MFTLKFYRYEGNYTRMMSADFLTILRDNGGAEITLHRLTGSDERIDVTSSDNRPEGWPPTYDRVIIENAAGKTTEIIDAEGVRSLLTTSSPKSPKMAA